MNWIQFLYSQITSNIKGGVNTIQSVVNTLAGNLDIARSPQSGSLLMTGAEQTLYENSNANPWEYIDGSIDLTSMQAGDTVIIRLYKKIKSGGGYVLFSSNSYSDGQAIPGKSITGGLYNIYDLKITAQQTAGVDRTFDYEFYDGMRSP